MTDAREKFRTLKINVTKMGKVTDRKHNIFPESKSVTTFCDSATDPKSPKMLNSSIFGFGNKPIMVSETVPDNNHHLDIGSQMKLELVGHLKEDPSRINTPRRTKNVNIKQKEAYYTHFSTPGQKKKKRAGVQMKSSS